MINNKTWDRIETNINELEEEITKSLHFRDLLGDLRVLLQTTKENIKKSRNEYFTLIDNNEPMASLKVSAIQKIIENVSRILGNLKGEVSNGLTSLFDVRATLDTSKTSKNDALLDKMSTLDDIFDEIIKEFNDELEALNKQLNLLINPSTADHKESTSQAVNILNDVKRVVEQTSQPVIPRAESTLEGTEDNGPLVRSDEFYYKAETKDENEENEAEEREKWEEEDKIMLDKSQEEKKIIVEKRKIAAEVEKVEKSSESWEAKGIDFQIAADIKANISAYLQDKKSFDHGETKYQIIQRKNNDELLEKGFLYLREGNGNIYYSCITPRGREIHDEKLDIPNLSSHYISNLTDNDQQRILAFVSDRKNILNKKPILDGLLDNVYRLSLQPGYAKQMKSLYDIYVAFRDLNPNINDDLVALGSLLEKSKKIFTKKSQVGLFNTEVNCKIQSIYEGIKILMNTFLSDYLTQLEPVVRRRKKLR